MRLLVPGPTPYPYEVLRALQRQAIYHRTKEFEEIMERVTQGLQEVFQTKNDLLMLTCSGTGGMEAAITNMLSPGDQVAVFTCGYFGERFAEIANTYSANVLLHSADWGNAVNPDDVDKLLLAEPRIKAVLVTHNETSTAITNPLEEIAAVVRRHDKLLIVDAVSSVGAIPVRTDEWGLDVVVTASQKGFMAPPGIAIISVNSRAWKAYDEARMPHFYFDFKRAKDSLVKNQTPWTPAIPVICALDAALNIMLREGLENIFNRHQRIADYTREQMRNLGLQLYGDQRYASDIVTAVLPPQEISADDIVKRLKEDYGLVVAGGWGALKNKIFRIAHLGRTEERDIDRVTRALREIITGGNFNAIDNE